jgi:uncharacterized protein with HEPN domain
MPWAPFFRMRWCAIWRSFKKPPSTEMAGMQDLLIHAYDRVDLEEVWITPSEQLPALLAQIEPVLRE